jgi:integrase
MMSLNVQEKAGDHHNTGAKKIRNSNVVKGRMSTQGRSRVRRANDDHQLDLFALAEIVPPSGDAEGQQVHVPAPVAPGAVYAAPAVAAPLGATTENALPAPANLAQVLARLDQRDRHDQRVANMRSAVKMVGKVLGQRLEDISTEPPVLAKRLAEANPALARMTPQRWIKVRSQTLAALRATGIPVLPGRNVARLVPQWQNLARRLKSQRLKCGLSRVMSYLSQRRISPEQTSLEHIEAYRRELLFNSLDPSPSVSFNCMARLWNEAEGAVAGWPQVRIEIGPRLRRYAKDPNEFPPSFRQDLEAFLTRSVNQDPFAEGAARAARSVRPVTANARRQNLALMATSLVNTGFPIDQVTSLAVLVDVQNAKALLRYERERAGGTYTPQMGNHLQLLCTIARHWVKAPEQDVELRELLATIRPKRRGMTPKNRQRLRQFDLQDNTAALLGLPARVLRDAQRKGGDEKGDAVRVMMALAVELLLMTTIRISNLGGIEVERHLTEVRRGRKAVRHLVIDPEDVKNEVPIQVPLPPETANLLNVYLETYRARICSPVGPYLFPGRGGARRSRESFSLLLKKFIRRETGLTMNPHLFRHLAAKLHLDVNPHEIEVVRQVLGHTSTKTTLRAYADLSSDAAFRRWDETVTGLRNDSAAHSKKPRMPKKES